MRALIVDDHGIARRGLAQLLEATFALSECVGVDTGNEALAAAGERTPDLILMDLQLPENPRGHVLCAQLRGVAVAATIAVVTAFDRSAEIQQCLAAGADGALLKDTADDDLIAQGCSNREIGERLVLSQGTVKDHVGALLKKLGASSRLQAVLRAAEAALP